MLDRMEPDYFSKVENGDGKAVLEIWEKHRGEMVDFLRKATVKHVSQENLNGECIEIVEGEAAVLQASRPACEDLSGRKFQRDIVRELFRVVGKASDEHSRWGAFALEDGWNKNKDDLPPFSLVGKYELTDTKSSHRIDVEIRRLASPSSEKSRLYGIKPTEFEVDPNNQYEIKAGNLTNGSYDNLILGPLRMSSATKGSASAKNPSSLTKSWEAAGIGIVARETGYGSEAVSVTFAAPDRIALAYTGKVTRWEWSENLSSPKQAFVRPLATSSAYYKGAKVR